MGEVGVVENLMDVVNVVMGYINWYGFGIVDKEDIVDDDWLKVVVVVEVLGVSCILVIIISDFVIVDVILIGDLVYKLKVVKYRCMFVQYFFSSKYVVLFVFGCVFMVNFNGSNIIIILKFKQELGIIYEILMIDQVVVLDVKKCNVFVYYQNDMVILQQGVMFSGDFFDECYGFDWLQNYVQINLYNLFYISIIKVLQIDVGVMCLLFNVEQFMDQFVMNGLVVVGVWNGGLIGQLDFGDMLIKGYYVYVQLIFEQVQIDCEVCKVLVIQVVCKLVGVVYFVDVQINVVC